MTLEANMSASTRYERRGDKLVAVRRVVDHQSGKPVAVRVTESPARGGRHSVPDAWRSTAPSEVDRAALVRQGLVREAGHGLPCLTLGEPPGEILRRHASADFDQLCGAVVGAA